MLRGKLESDKVTPDSDDFAEGHDDDCFDLGLDADDAFRTSFQGRALRESILASSTIGNKSSIPTRNKFLGIVDKRYVRTFTGLFHAITSVASLVIGNYLFGRVIVLNHSYDDDRHVDSMATAFHLVTFLSGATLLPFWHKVQSWQLSTTTMSQKGLSSKQMQQFNRGRGVVAPILSAIYPLLYRYLNRHETILDDATTARLIGALILSVTLYQYTLIRDYGKALFIVYGGSKMGFSLHLLSTGSFSSLGNQYPYAIDYLEKEALLVTCCVEFGFLWYYLYSRRLVTKEFVQTMCKNYHPAVLYIWVGRLTVDRWWSKLPLSLSWVMALNSLLTALFLIKMIKSLIGSGNQAPSKHTFDFGTDKEEEEEEKGNNPKENHRQEGRSANNTGRKSRLGGGGARSSIFEVQSPRTGMRSSVFESISVASRFERIGEEKSRRD